MSAERPAKRIRQACEPCRRKKSRCPGEKPVCSHCSRLRQKCFYADEPPHSNDTASSEVATALYIEAQQTQGNDTRLEDRLKVMETKLAEVLANQASLSRSDSRPVSRSPAPIAMDPTRAPSTKLSSSIMPSWDIVAEVAELYLVHCDCQPLPLFHRGTFIETLATRDFEVVFAMLALATRFLDDSRVCERPLDVIAEYAEASRTVVMRKIVEGSVELSTLQALCLLTLVDFSNGNTRRASVHSSLAMSLAGNAGLTTETNLAITDAAREERRRCFWSLFLLKRLHGADFGALDFSGEENFPWYPETTGKAAKTSTQMTVPSVSSGDEAHDKGIVAYAIQLSEVWFKITRYAKRRGKPSTLPPWSPQSEYAIIMAQQMESETRMPYFHRFKPSEITSKSTEELHMNRDYWGPWVFVQLLYHTNLCLLNHPLLLSLRLRNFKSMIPEIFIQHTSDLISSHSSWIMHLIAVLEAKSFKVSDPFLGHCVAIVATIYLQESFAEDTGIRKEKRDKFTKCLDFVRGFGSQWPHVARIADKLQRLGETVSSTYLTSNGHPQTPNRNLLIDLGQFWEILEYSSSSELANSANLLFGSSLYLDFHQSITEIAHTSALPPPTRVDSQEVSVSACGTLDSGYQKPYSSGMPLLYSDDELAVLAESFFQQKPEFEGSIDDWWNTGNL